MTNLLRHDSSMPDRHDCPPEVRGRTPVYRNGSLHITEFHRLLRSGTPVILTGIHESFQERWDPSYFKDAFGHEEQIVVECESEVFAEAKITLGEFLDTFLKKRHERTRILKVKVCEAHS